MDLSKLTAEERLAAEQAVLTLRALNEAADKAPHGQGMACLEACIAEKGFEHLRKLLTLATSARDEAQKRGPASGPATAGNGRSSRTSTSGRS